VRFSVSYAKVQWNTVHVRINGTRYGYKPRDGRRTVRKLAKIFNTLYAAFGRGEALSWLKRHAVMVSKA